MDTLISETYTVEQEYMRGRWTMLSDCHRTFEEAQDRCQGWGGLTCRVVKICKYLSTPDTGERADPWTR